MPQFRTMPTNGIRLHIAEQGPPDGELVFLLHGFPEFWYGWRHQIGPLAAAGFRVIAPDQRGYNLSDKPADVPAYDLDAVAADILGLADACGRASFAVVGHDWGAVVGWWLATRHPDRLRRLVVLNAPHPSVWREAMRRSLSQRARSWYVQFFRLPHLPELVLRRRGFEALVSSLRQAIRPDAFSESDLQEYRQAWSRPGALTAMLNWYRALSRKALPAPDQCRIRVPTKIIWGVRDPYVGRALAEQTLRLCERGEIAYVEHASHWIQHDCPDEVTRLLIDGLRPETRAPN